LGSSNGVTFKSFINKNPAIEAIATFRYQGIGLTGLYEIHGSPEISTDSLAVAEHIYVWRNDGPKFLDRGQTTVLGLSRILGLEVKLSDIALAISLDWKPNHKHY